MQQSSSPWCWFHRPRRPRASLSDVYSLPSYSPPASDVYSLPSYSPPAAGSVSPASSTAGRPASEELAVAGGWLRSASRWRRRRRGQSRAVAPAADRRLRALQNIGIAPTWRRWPERHLPGHRLPVLYPAMWRRHLQRAPFVGDLAGRVLWSRRLRGSASSPALARGVIRWRRQAPSRDVIKRHQDKRPSRQASSRQASSRPASSRQSSSGQVSSGDVIKRRHHGCHHQAPSAEPLTTSYVAPLCGDDTCNVLSSSVASLAACSVVAVGELSDRRRPRVASSSVIKTSVIKLNTDPRAR